ncbi:hypothetical protein AAG906_025500 [Vitis piasezkii]
MLQKSFSRLSNPETKAIPDISAVWLFQECFCIAFNNAKCEAPYVPDYVLQLLDQLGPSIVDLFFCNVPWCFVEGFSVTTVKVGMPSKLQFESDDLLVLLWMCWIMTYIISYCVMYRSCSDLNVWDCDITRLEVQLPAGKIHTWALNTVPNLADCFSEMEASSSSVSDVSSAKSCDAHLLTCGRRGLFPITEKEGSEESLLYRSSLHGKGLNRFWSNIEVIMAQSGFQNKDMFYGNSGNLYAISPVFHSFHLLGRRRTLCIVIYILLVGHMSHIQSLRIAFGGTIGNERIFIDEDFARVTVRHHAVDKTYQPGSLIPDQVDAETLKCMGIGWKNSQEVQISFQKREQLFTEQRRKVDLKTFASWDDSPEKMMMDVMSDPNRVNREDR